MSDIGDYKMGGPRRPLVDPEASLIRVGQRFLHKRQWRTDVPASVLMDKSVPAEEKAQLFEITAVRLGRVYYAAIERRLTGGEWRAKTADYMPIERFESYAVLQYVFPSSPSQT